jgi:hypothetical protein
VDDGENVWERLIWGRCNGPNNARARFVCGKVLEWLVRRAEIERMPSNRPKREVIRYVYPSKF